MQIKVSHVDISLYKEYELIQYIEIHVVISSKP